MFGVLLDVVYIIIVVTMVIIFFNVANDLAEEKEESAEPIPEHVYEQLPNGDGLWE
jgi:hypothetical protein